MKRVQMASSAAGRTWSFGSGGNHLTWLAFVHAVVGDHVELVVSAAEQIAEHKRVNVAWQLLLAPVRLVAFGGQREREKLS